MCPEAGTVTDTASYDRQKSTAERGLCTSLESQTLTEGALTLPADPTDSGYVHENGGKGGAWGESPHGGEAWSSAQSQIFSHVMQNPTPLGGGEMEPTWGI